MMETVRGADVCALHLLPATPTGDTDVVKAFGMQTGDALGETVPVPDADGVIDAVLEFVDERDALGVAVGLRDARDGEAVFVAVRVLDWVSETDDETVMLLELLNDAVLEGEIRACSFGLSDLDGDSVEAMVYNGT